MHVASPPVLLLLVRLLLVEVGLLLGLVLGLELLAVLELGLVTSLELLLCLTRLLLCLARLLLLPARLLLLSARLLGLLAALVVSTGSMPAASVYAYQSVMGSRHGISRGSAEAEQQRRCASGKRGPRSKSGTTAPALGPGRRAQGW